MTIDIRKREIERELEDLIWEIDEADTDDLDDLRNTLVSTLDDYIAYLREYRKDGGQIGMRGEE